MKLLVFKAKDLPVPIVVVGEDGAREVYQLAPASRKLGASLQKLCGQVKESVLRLLDRK